MGGTGLLLINEYFMLSLPHSQHIQDQTKALSWSNLQASSLRLHVGLITAPTLPFTRDPIAWQTCLCTISHKCVAWCSLCEVSSLFHVSPLTKCHTTMIRFAMFM